MIAFYNDKLPALGWTAGETSTNIPGLATLEFTKDGKKATITITESEGKTTVLIAIQ